jgi:hypothetical protein
MPNYSKRGQKEKRETQRVLTRMTLAKMVEETTSGHLKKTMPETAEALSGLAGVAGADEDVGIDKNVNAHAGPHAQDSLVGS